jgi:hypothetical protein
VSVRLYRDGGGGLRFAGKDAEVERLAARAILDARREAEDQLHERNMALLGETSEPSGGTRQVLRPVRDEVEEALWRAWLTYCA